MNGPATKSKKHPRDEFRLCYVCKTPLQSATEQRVGTHIKCVFEMDRRKALKDIPRPQYGTRRIDYGE